MNGATIRAGLLVGLAVIAAIFTFSERYLRVPSFDGLRLT